MSHLRRITLLLALIPLLAHSQTLRKDVEIGAMLGAMNYIGDLNSQSAAGKMNIAGSALLRYDFHSRWAVQFGFAYGNIEGGNAKANNTDYNVYANYNNYCPTPYEEGSEGFERAMSKLMGTYQAKSQGADYSDYYASWS